MKQKKKSAAKKVKPPSSVLEELKAAIVKAVPGLHIHKEFGAVLDENKCPHELGLEDVMRALWQNGGINKDFAVANSGWFLQTTPDGWKLASGSEKSLWVFGTPLSSQSPECLAFLHGLLCK